MSDLLKDADWISHWASWQTRNPDLRFGAEYKVGYDIETMRHVQGLIPAIHLRDRYTNFCARLELKRNNITKA